MKDAQIIDLTPDNIADYGVCGYKDVRKHIELKKKIEWFNQYHSKGLKIKVIISETGGYQGMLEYIPGEYAHRPVKSEGYLFIHCVFVGFKKEYKGKGFASSLIDEAIEEAREKKMYGVAVVTRNGPFMSGSEIFLKKGFEVIEKAEPDFELLVLKFDKKFENPKFKPNMDQQLKKYNKGLTLIRSVQCPYTEKNVNAIIDTAKKKFQLDVNLVDLESPTAAQSTPCAFGTFCIIYNGKVLSHHPISNTRFENIMNKVLKK